MGQVAVTLKAMPSSSEVDLGKIKKDVEEAVSKFEDIKLEQINEKPVAFGLKCLEILLTMPDQGGTDNVEESITKIDGIESVDTENITII